MPLAFPDQDAFPNSAVVYVQVAWDDGSFTRGSGALVGRNDVLTAAHVVYNPGRAPIDIDVFPAFDGRPGPYGAFTRGLWQVDHLPIEIRPGGLLTAVASASDLAVIGLSAPLGDAAGTLGLAPEAGTDRYAVLGFPSMHGTRLTGDEALLGFPYAGVFGIAGLAIGPGSSGGPLLNAALQVVGVVSTSLWAARIDTEWPALQGWMAENDALLDLGLRFFSVTASGSGVTRDHRAEAYAGPVTGLERQYLASEADEVVVGTASRDFIHTRGGRDGVDGGAGGDVIDGGTGSNFVTGGAGLDVFFLDGRGGVTTWSTITDWQPGEQLSLWGYQPGRSVLTWAGEGGTAGFRGVTLHADLDGDGNIDTSVTWSSLVLRAQLPTAREYDGLLWFT